jgi:amino acid adenylation domain-containing protein
VVGEEERDEILRRGATAAPPESSGPPRIDQLFAEIARRFPDAPAVSDGRASVTYRELDALAGRLAAGLSALGVGPGDPVGVCLERGMPLVAVLLAVLKAGGVYVPMDLRNPPERLAYMVKDAGVPVVVTESTTGSGFPDVEGVRLVAPDELERPDQPARVGGGTTAYVIYTSGSTGRPKGVPVPHANVLVLIRATKDEFALGPADVWTFFHSSAFDFSVWEIWGCLLTGGHLVVVPYWVSRSPGEFRRLLEEEGVTVLNQTPTAFGQLIAADLGESGNLAVRLVVLGGEPLDTRMLAPWFARHSPAACRVVNMFGITETTVHVTMRTVTPADTELRSRNVGRAIPGWSVSVRDGCGRVLPFGAAGEIYVGGAGVALGYLGRPELTAERFVVDEVTGVRLYRSGDRGRLHPDGSLDHLGRIDSQVKVRGHRIELDEIRAVLMEDPEVVQAAVVFDGARIAACAVLKPGTSPRTVLRRCARLLPDYMVPVALTEVESMPLTINGKVDMNRLPSRPPALPVMPDESSDPLAEKVLGLWSRHLETKVGVTDNFFEFGGNSLLVVRMLSDLKGLGLPTPTVRQFYGNSTAARFTELLRELMAQTLEA